MKVTKAEYDLLIAIVTGKKVGGYYVPIQVENHESTVKSAKRKKLIDWRYVGMDHPRMRLTFTGEVVLQSYLKKGPVDSIAKLRALTGASYDNISKALENIPMSKIFKRGTRLGAIRACPFQHVSRWQKDERKVDRLMSLALEELYRNHGDYL